MRRTFFIHVCVTRKKSAQSSLFTEHVMEKCKANSESIKGASMMESGKCFLSMGNNLVVDWIKKSLPLLHKSALIAISAADEERSQLTKAILCFCKQWLVRNSCVLVWVAPFEAGHIVGAMLTVKTLEWSGWTNFHGVLFTSGTHGVLDLRIYSFQCCTLYYYVRRQ